MARKQHDKALRAVERVRGLREKAARQQLAFANQHLAEAQAHLSATQDLREAHLDQPSNGGFEARLLHHERSAVLAEAVRDSADGCDKAAASTYVAQERWRETKTDLSAIENLLEQRAAARAAQQLQAEAKEADDVNTRRSSRLAMEADQ